MSYRSRALVTGATGAIGAAIARGLASDNAREVVLVARNREKAERTVQRLRQETGNHHVRFELADLSRGDAIRDLAAGWEGPLHILVNTANRHAAVMHNGKIIQRHHAVFY